MEVLQLKERYAVERDVWGNMVQLKLFKNVKL